MPPTPPPGIVLRPAARADAERLARGVIEGFEHYRAFAPAGWEPPPLAQELETVRTTLSHPAGWCLMAESEAGELAGQTSFLPATAARHPSDEPGLAYFRTLFVDATWWGTGLAGVLHEAAVAEARRQGYANMALVTPALQARARRFYEREGWVQDGAERDEPALGIAIVGYRLALDQRR